MPITCAIGIAELCTRGTRNGLPSASRAPSRAVFSRRLHLAGLRRRRSPSGAAVMPTLFRCAAERRSPPPRPTPRSRCPARRDRRAPYSARPCNTIRTALCRARWWTFARRHTLGRLPARLLPAGVLSAVPPPVLQELRAAFAEARLRFFGDLAHLADFSAELNDLDQLRRTDGRHAKPPFGGPEQVLAYLGRYTHRVAIANSRLISLADGKGELFLEGLSAELQGQGDDDSSLSPAHPAGRLPPHFPPLWLPRQWRTQR